MGADLFFSSDEMHISITNYEKYQFCFKGWCISDKYFPDGQNTHWSRYSIIVTKSDINDNEELQSNRMTGHDIIDLITLFKFLNFAPLSTLSA